MGEIANNSNVNYQALEQERYVQTRAALKLKLKSVSETDLGRNGSLRRVILGLVISESYERGKEELQTYVTKIAKHYPLFGDRAEKFVKHGCDLIQAIQVKRTFPGLGSLSLGKQQELNERVLTHFQELKQTLKTIERAEKEIKLSDLRSTGWMALVVGHTVVFLTIAFFIMHLRNGLWYSFDAVFNALVDDAVGAAERLLGWR